MVVTVNFDLLTHMNITTTLIIKEDLTSYNIPKFFHYLLRLSHKPKRTVTHAFHLCSFSKLGYTGIQRQPTEQIFGQEEQLVAMSLYYREGG